MTKPDYNQPLGLAAALLIVLIVLQYGRTSRRKPATASSPPLVLVPTQYAAPTIRIQNGLIHPENISRVLLCTGCSFSTILTVTSPSKILLWEDRPQYNFITVCPNKVPLASQNGYNHMTYVKNLPVVNYAVPSTFSKLRKSLIICGTNVFGVRSDSTAFINAINFTVPFQRVHSLHCLDDRVVIVQGFSAADNIKLYSLHPVVQCLGELETSVRWAVVNQKSERNDVYVFSRTGVFVLLQNDSFSLILKNPDSSSGSLPMFLPGGVIDGKLVVPTSACLMRTRECDIHFIVGANVETVWRNHSGHFATGLTVNHYGSFPVLALQNDTIVLLWSLNNIVTFLDSQAAVSVYMFYGKVHRAVVTLLTHEQPLNWPEEHSKRTVQILFVERIDATKQYTPFEGVLSQQQLVSRCFHRLYFVGYDIKRNVFEMYHTDGTLGGTRTLPGWNSTHFDINVYLICIHNVLLYLEDKTVPGLVGVTADLPYTVQTTDTITPVPPYDVLYV